MVTGASNIHRSIAKGHDSYPQHAGGCIGEVARWEYHYDPPPGRGFFTHTFLRGDDRLLTHPRQQDSSGLCSICDCTHTPLHRCFDHPSSCSKRPSVCFSPPSKPTITMSIQISTVRHFSWCLLLYFRLPCSQAVQVHHCNREMVEEAAKAQL